MDRLPSPFDRILSIRAGERFLACWYAQKVVRADDGRLVWATAVKARGGGYVRPRDIDVTKGLLLLTDHGLAHVRMSGFEPKLYPPIPFPQLLGVDVARFPTDPRPALRLRVQREAPGADPSEAWADGSGPVNLLFLVGRSESVESVARAILDAAGLAPLPSTLSAGSIGPSPHADEDDGPIHLHAEQDPEE